MFIKIEPVRYKKNDENNIIQSNRKILEERYTVVKDIDCHIIEQLETEAKVEKEIPEAAEFEKAVIEILLNIELFLRKYHYAVAKPKSQLLIVSAFFLLTGRVAAKMLWGRVPFPVLGGKTFRIGGANIVTLWSFGGWLGVCGSKMTQRYQNSLTAS